MRLPYRQLMFYIITHIYGLTCSIILYAFISYLIIDKSNIFDFCNLIISILPKLSTPFLFAFTLSVTPYCLTFLLLSHFILFLVFLFNHFPNFDLGNFSHLFIIGLIISKNILLLFS